MLPLQRELQAQNSRWLNIGKFKSLSNNLFSGLQNSFISNLRRGTPMSTILLVVLILVLIGAFPSWPYSRGWGYGPSGLLGVLLVVLVIYMVTRGGI